MGGAENAAAAAITILAREWIGTPYRHQASLKGVGADCLGLVRGVWRERYGDEPVALPPYSRDWCECSGEEALWRATARWFSPGTGENAGEVLLFRMAPGAPAKHLAITAKDVGGRPTIIHAYSGRAVIESIYSDSWRRRTVAAFTYPERA
ncbi:MAG: NlpC/P60 family protein [Paracoccaceae bacterium]